MRVLVIDDNEATALLFCELAKACGCESRYCTNPAVAVDITREWQPNVILLDVATPGIDGYRLAPMLRAAGDGAIQQILAIGEYVADAEKLSAATIDGHVVRPASLAERGIVESCLVNGATSNSQSLTAREREVSRLIAHGYSNKEIAEGLQISVKTVDTHKARIMDKLRISTRAELVRLALHEGWLGKE
jgi:DNA-binding NarL/FixJ family response regulator